MNKKILIFLLIIAATVAAGILGLDKLIYGWARPMNAPVWKVFDAVFAFKTWFVVSGIFFAYYLVKSSNWNNVFAKNDGLCKKACKFAVKTKNNIVDFIKNINSLHGFGKIVSWMFLSVSASGIICGISKVAAGRMRPVFYDALGITGWYPGSFDWAFNSMPSGHVAASFAALTILATMIPRARWLAYGLATVIGLSRIFMGAHWFSDVVAGAAIGYLLSLILTRRLRFQF
ncbi:MAG: phosphatase PAP2 family protein [Rickettsiales bacterium]|jgi:membrane-associated phospholipid phosphatase|nr:phosphatase PAP2 family protein [Rickettsiales bacterium]